LRHPGCPHTTLAHLLIQEIEGVYPQRATGRGARGFSGSSSARPMQAVSPAGEGHVLGPVGRPRPGRSAGARGRPRTPRHQLECCWKSRKANSHRRVPSSAQRTGSSHEAPDTDSGSPGPELEVPVGGHPSGLSRRAAWRRRSSTTSE